MKIGLKRKLAGLLVMLMVVSVILCDRSALSAQAGGSCTVRFSGGTVSGNDVTYAVGEQNVTLTVSGGNIADEAVIVPDMDNSSVSFILSNNFSSDTMQVRVSAEDGFGTTLAVTNNVTSLANKTNEGGLPDALNLVVEPIGNTGGGNQGGNQEGNQNPGEEEPSVSWTLDLKIGDTEYHGLQGDQSYRIEKMEDAQNITVLRQKKNDEEWLDSIDALEKLGLSGKSMSTTCLDAEGRGALEVQTISKGENFITVNLQSHYRDSFGVTEIEEFYVTNITFYVEKYEGVMVEQAGAQPDMFDNLILSNQVDIADTTKESPQTILQYFANDTFTVAGVENPGDVQQVELADSIIREQLPLVVIQ